MSRKVLPIGALVALTAALVKQGGAPVAEVKPGKPVRKFTDARKAEKARRKKR